ncbi:MAG: hypothetical protein ING36_15360 [Burkholderiales bacterium]|jgi:hypothetical protein|nr:hypothetical protein [Burkholderiales bacterium]
MRHYLDQYVRLAAENFEKELTRVAGFDEEAKKILANNALQDLLKKLKNGEITAPSNAFDGVEMWFQTDDKYCNQWASGLYYKLGEKKLFSALANLTNVLRYYKNDLELTDYCKRISFTFPDGWPNDPERFAETLRLTEQEQNQQDKQKPLSLIQRLKQWLT